MHLDQSQCVCVCVCACVAVCASFKLDGTQQSANVHVVSNNSVGSVCVCVCMSRDEMCASCMVRVSADVLVRVLVCVACVGQRDLHRAYGGTCGYTTHGYDQTYR